MSQPDLVLIHAPSVYDFRQHAIMYGPISDLIPSSPVFEMYPLGFLTMNSYLEERGLEVRIVNLALRMINDRHFDVPAFLAKLKPKAFGIDLHWLPHAHGSLEVAALLKELHPDIPILFGGLSSTYFHEDLIEYDQVDYVLRGDSIEPPLYELMTSIIDHRRPDDVPNLTWKADGVVHVNPFTFQPQSLDYVDLRPDLIGKMAIRYRDRQSVIPFNGWWQNPITAVFTVKGCAHECATCGSSQKACHILGTRRKPVFRSPKSLVKNMADICRFSRGPIFLVGDLRQAGDKHAYEVLRLLKEADFKNEIVFELFSMPPVEFIQEIDRCVENWSLELSPESHDVAIRGVQDKSCHYSNEEMERIIQEALSLRCHRVDIFFMIGLPGQTRQSVLQTIDYCEHLFQTTDERVLAFISPMGPFLDPGSLTFEEPEKYGYTLFAHTLDEHRQHLVQPSWKGILTYETKWMTRDEIVEVTYDAGEALNELKLKYQRISPKAGGEVAEHITSSRELKAKLDLVEQMELDPEQAQRFLDSGQMSELEGEIFEYSVSTVCDKTELFWPRHMFNFKPLGLLAMAGSYVRDLFSTAPREIPVQSTVPSSLPDNLN